MKAICIGSKSFPAKSGDSCYVYNFVVPFSAYDIQRGAVGMDIKSYVTFNFFHVQPNEHYELVFEPDFRGQAQLVNAIHLEKGV